MLNKQIYFTAPKVAELIEKDVPRLNDDNILVEMVYTVISSGTEKACLLGMQNTTCSFPSSLGYCGVGYIIKIGSNVKNFKDGDCVLVYHGYHAKYNVVKEEQLTKVDDNSIELIEAAFVIIMAMSLGGIRKLEIEIGESAMIMGQGILGIFATQLARISGAYPVIAADLNADRRNLALELGADYAFNPADDNFIQKVRSVTDDRGVNATVEVTGVSVAMKQALECASWMGRISLLGCTRVSDSSVDYYQQVHRPGVKLIGAHNLVRPKFDSYPHHWTHHDDCRALLKLISSGRIRVKPVVSQIETPTNAPEIYLRLAEDSNFPLGVVFDWKN